MAVIPSPGTSSLPPPAAVPVPSPGTQPLAATVHDPTRACRLISGPVALSAQLVLLAVVLTALSIKRHRERPRRALVVWLLDVAKQATSAGAGHIVGMGVAIVAHARSGQASECGWYFVVYFMDCSLGITLAITFHKLTTGLARWCSVRGAVAKEFGEEHAWWEALIDSGHYGDANAPNYKKWAIQVFAWASCVVTARLIVGCTVVGLIPVLSRITAFMDMKFTGHPDAYLFTVMVAIPLVVNIGQAWIQDQVLKWKHKKHPSSSKREDEEGLGHRDSEGGAEGGLMHGGLAGHAVLRWPGSEAGGDAGGAHMQTISSYQQLSKPSERIIPTLLSTGGKGE